MKLAQLHEARYAGDHPIVKKIKAEIAKGGYDFFTKIEDVVKAENAEKGILAGFGPPDEQGPATEDEYRSMIWNLDDERTLQLVWLPRHKKIAMRRGQTAPKVRETTMEIALI